MILLSSTLVIACILVQHVPLSASTSAAILNDNGQIVLRPSENHSVQVEGTLYANGLRVVTMSEVQAAIATLETRLHSLEAHFPCASSPCLNGGQCAPTNGAFTCDCYGTRHVGERCESLATFSATWRIGPSRVQLQLPLLASGTYNFTVDWGDNSRSTITHYNQAEVTHVYAQAGTYTTAVQGVLDGWRFAGNGDATALVDIGEWGPLRLGNDGNYFEGATSLQVSATDALDLTGTTSLNRVFYECFNLTMDVTGLARWRTGHITDMAHAFYRCYHFTGDGLTDWDMRNITDLSYTFYENHKLASALRWHTTDRLTELFHTFLGARVFTGDGLDQWDVSRVESLSHCFYGCHQFNGPIEAWRTSYVATFESTFYECSSLTRSLAQWDVSGALSLRRMLFRASRFDSNVTTWDMSRVQVATDLFKECAAFQGRGVEQWNTSSLVYAGGLFDGCANFTGNVSGWDVSRVREAQYMFHECRLFNSDLSRWNTRNIEQLHYAFLGCTLFEGSGLAQWDTSAVRTMFHLFYGCERLTADLSQWNVGRVESFDFFAHETTLWTSDLSQWNTSTATSMRSMFHNAVAFSSDLSGWDVSRVLDMTRMFKGAVAFSSDLSSWCVQQIASRPSEFDLDVVNWLAPRPVWGQAC